MHKKIWSSIFNSKGVILLILEYLLSKFLDYVTSSEIFINNCCDMHECAAPVSNIAVIGSILRSLTTKFDNLNFAYSRLDMVSFCI